MTTDQIRVAYLDFFKSKDHQLIPPAPLIPPDDPTTLFTSSGMQQLVPYLKGQPHPMGKRLTDSQPCFRAEDIDEVGDNRHTTFFEMLGNWSLGDYFKAEQLSWIWEFLTKTLSLPKEKLYVSLFKGSQDIPKDEESLKIWEKLGVPESRIHFYDATKNWWSRAGTPDQMPPGTIGGTTSEIFYKFDQVKHDPKYGKTCHPNCDCGRFVEIGNSVFMEYEKQADGFLKPLPQKNVDFGGGLERLTAAVQNTPDIFQIDSIKPLIQSIETTTDQSYSDLNQPPMRVIADHLRAAQAMLDQGIEPSNKQQGYILRRLIRRSAVKFRQLTGDLQSDKLKLILDNSILLDEIAKFKTTLNKGLKLIEKTNPKQINEKLAFDLFQTYGFPFEITQEILNKQGIKLNKKKFDKNFQSHQQQSRTASAGMFKGGLKDQSSASVKLHTATHLLHQALRQVLGDHVQQQGSHITPERLRFDFTHDQPLTDDQLKAVEKLVNQQIKKDLPVTKAIEAKDKALKSGALAFFTQSYPDQVTVYSIGSFSKELCGGPHVASTGEIGGVKIIKQASIAAGRRRLYAVLTNGSKKPRHQTKT